MTVPQEQFDAVAAAQAQAQAIAAKFEQQQAATGEAAPGSEDYGNNKRKFEDEGAADLGAEDQMRKRSSFNGPEGGYNGVRPRPGTRAATWVLLGSTSARWRMLRALGTPHLLSASVLNTSTHSLHKVAVSC